VRARVRAGHGAVTSRQGRDRGHLLHADHDRLLAARAWLHQRGRRRARRLAQLAVLTEPGRVLVTGAAGFVGGYLCAALGEAAVPSSADVTDAAALEAEVAEAAPAAIVHLAAVSSTTDALADPAAAWHVNAVGTVNLTEAVRRAAPRARLLVVSTGEVYGDTGDGPADEGHPIAPRSPYAASKAAAEIAADQAARAYGLDVVLARPFAHTGPGHDQRFALPSFAYQIAELERAGGGELKVGDLSVHRDLLDVRDVVAAYTALLAPDVPATTYNVARGSSVPLSDLVDVLVAEATAPIRVVRDPARLRVVDTHRLCGDPARLRAATGWTPTHSHAETLAALLAAARRSVIGDTAGR
jgi:GDP-4-dehydro-6-deoxy-D-mannose reductase